MGYLSDHYTNYSIDELKKEKVRLNAKMKMAIERHQVKVMI